MTSALPLPSPLEGEGWVGGKINYSLRISEFLESILLISVIMEIIKWLSVK
jgi:hypothetical protein